MALSALAASGPAQAASGPAHAVVTACKADSMTVVGAVKLSGPAARKARGAKLQIQFRAMPLFGLPKLGPLHALGTKTSGSAQDTFTGLSANSWGAVMSWRFKKGSRTVASGLERSQPGRAGSARGAGFCTIAEGLKPADTTPPTLSIQPADDIWHHGPAQVYVLAQDDFSGVRSVTYSVDGGPATPVQNGTSFTIDGEGAHAVHLTATDVAGNVGTRDQIVRVDQNPPTQPQLSSPPSVTASTTPTFNWSASTDSGSGLKGYVLVIKRASDGSIVSFTPLGPGTTSAQSPQALSDGETYTASVIAVDNTDTPFTSESDPRTFRVDTQPGIASSSPSDGGIAAGSLKSGPLTVTLDRPADHTTVSSSTVVLHQVEGSGGDKSYTVDCDSSCTTISVHPSSALGEGRWTITLNGVKSEEGVTIPGTVHFAVPFVEDSSNSVTANPCPLTMSKTDTAVIHVANQEAGTLTFGYSVSGGGTGNVHVSSTAGGGGDSGALTGSNTATVPLTLQPDATTQTITIQYSAMCSTGQSATTLTVTNVVASRNP